MSAEKLNLVGQEQWVARAIARRRRALEEQQQPGSPQHQLIQGDIDALTAILKTVQLHRRFQECIHTVRQMPGLREFPAMSSKRRLRKNACDGKRRFKTIGEACRIIKRVRRSAQADHAETLTPYRCRFCKGIHFGHRGAPSAAASPIGAAQ